MLDFLRNLTRSEDEKRSETIAAYVDEALSDRERRQFEQRLARDPALRYEIEQQRRLKRSLATLPRRRVPRNFTLDPVVYGRPAAQPLLQLYPVLRAATVLTALIFMVTVSADLLTGTTSLGAPAQEVPAAAEAVEELQLESEGEAEQALAATQPAVSAAEPMVAPSGEEEEAEAMEEAVEEPAVADAAVAEEAAAEEAPATEEEETAELRVDSTTGLTAAATAEAAATPAEAPAGGGAPLPSTSPPPQPTLGPAPTTLSEAESPAPAATDELAAAVETATLETEARLSQPAPAEAQRLPPAPAVEPGPGLLRLLQIGSGLAFLLLAGAWWLARRRL